jgi:protoporphyrinogen oxidase
MARVAVLGAGVSGAYAAWKLAAAGHQVTLYDKLAHIGGLASSFQQYGRYYPLGYHQILSSDTFLHQVLKELGLWGRVLQNKVKMLFWYQGRAYDFGNPLDVLRFPLPLKAKLGLARLAAVARLKSNWDDLSW